MVMHTEFTTPIKTKNLSAIEFIIYNNNLMAPALLYTRSRGFFTQFTGHGSKRPLTINIKGFIVNVDIIGWLSHKKLVKFTTPLQ
jgi:hypothetical protein